MVNAWSLLGAYLDGPLEEECPIMNKKFDDDVASLVGESTDTVTFSAQEPGMAATDNNVSADLDPNNVYAADTVNASWWGDDGFSVVGNPIVSSSASPDTISLPSASINIS